MKKNLLIIGIWLLFPLAVQPVWSANEVPNILLIMADDVGSDAVGCYGGQSYPTPHIDSLAAEGIRFRHGYSMPVCHPSRICLLTGRYPFRFGAAGLRWGDFPKEAEGITIAHRLKQAGYATAIAGKWQLCMMKDDLKHPNRLGFDEWCLFGWHEGGRYHNPLIYQNGKRLLNTRDEYGPDLYVQFLIDFMERQRQAGKPFFAYYPMALSHDVTNDLKDQYVTFYQDDRWMTYAEMMASMDDRVGRLLAALDAMKLKQDTLVLFTTDNGTPKATYLYVDEAGEMVRTPVYSVRHNQVVPGGKGKLDDTGTRVPLIVRWPGRIKAGETSEVMVDLTDLLPTMAEIAEVQNQDVPRDGISFAPVLEGRARERSRSWVYTEKKRNDCIRSRDWRLYRDGRCFDLRNDPKELNPVVREHLSPSAQDAIAQLQSQLDLMQIDKREVDAPAGVK